MPDSAPYLVGQLLSDAYMHSTGPDEAQGCHCKDYHSTCMVLEEREDVTGCVAANQTHFALGR
jgi:hypothetical protein